MSLTMSTVDVLLGNFDLSFLSIMDVVALVKVKKTLSKQKANRRNTMMSKALKRMHES